MSETCHECGYPEMRVGTTYANCPHCGYEWYGLDCEHCGREFVAEIHLAPDGATCEASGEWGYARPRGKLHHYSREFPPHDLPPHKKRRWRPEHPAPKPPRYTQVATP